MNIPKFALIGACLLGAAGIASGAAEADRSTHSHRGKMHAHGFGGEPPLARLVRKLELSEEQRQSLDSLLESTKVQRETLREEQRRLMQASMSTLPDDPSYPALVEKRKQLASAAIQRRSDLNVQIYALLTQEQKAQVPGLIEEAKANAKQRRGKREGKRHREGDQ